MNAAPEEISALLEKSRRSLSAAEKLNKEGDYDFAASRAYYAMFYAAKAALLKEGHSPATHRGIISQFWQHLVISGHINKELHKTLNEAMTARSAGDYEVMESVLSTVAEKTISDASRFTEAVQKYIKE